MSMLDRKEPNTTGQPGRISCDSAMPDSASVICCTRAAGIVTGDIAPIRMNGVRTTGWFAVEYSNCASSIRSSQRSGLLQLISEMIAGVSSIDSRGTEEDLGHRDGVGGVRAADDVAHVDLVGQRLQRVGHVEVAAVERGVVRLVDHAAGAVERREALGEAAEVPEVLHGAVAAYVALAHERRTVDRPERHRVAADVHAVRRVAGLEVELTRRLRDLLEHEVGVQEDGAVLDPLPGCAEQVERSVVQELDADLGHQPTPALVEGRHRVLGQHLVTGHPVAEHRASCLTS